MDLFFQRHADKVAGVLSCWDRVVITGTIPGICFAKGMTGFLNANGIRIFDYPKWAEPLRNRDLQHSLSIGGRQVSAVPRRLREHGPIKKVAGTFKYYLTAFGRRVIATGLKLREMAVIPLLQGMLPTAA